MSKKLTMKTYTYNATDDDLTNIINDSDIAQINQHDSVLIQLFSGQSSDKIKRVLKYLKKKFSHATIITSSTDGEINQYEVLTLSTVISISTFSKTTLKSTYVKECDSFQTGVKLAKNLITEKTKLIIAFADGLLCNGEEFLNGIYSVNPDIIVAGGLSGDNSKFINCYVGEDDKLYDNGAVGVAFDSDELIVNSLYNFGWKAIGLKHTITKAKANRLYTINDISAVEFYKKYLGDEITEELPSTGIEFPLIIDKNGFKKARAVTAKHDDGSLSFAGNISNGDSVYLGVGEVDSILSNHLETLDNTPVESFFIYSCMARRRFIPELISKEIIPFSNSASTSGFFTYGEFYTDKKPQLLNQTLTAVALSESDTTMKQIKNKAKKPIKENRTFQALTNIINATSKELNKQTVLQEKISNELTAKTNTLNLIQEIANIGSWELDLKTMQMTWSDISCKMFNIEKNSPPTYTEFLEMVLPEDRVRLLKVKDSLNNEDIQSIEIRAKRNDGKVLTLVESGKLVFDNNKPIKIVGTTLDITEIKIQNHILMQQSKSAQMGEMINMIAHQWRQPLNAISAVAIKLNMLSEMDLITKDEIKKTTDFIEDMTQKMSQTINDFMDFTKPTNTKELVDFDTLLDNIFNIIGTQLANHNIDVEINIEPKISLYTYKKELEHVIINILTNTRDALMESIQEHKKIKIKISSLHSLCIIEISDNAGGIKEDIIDRIFDPYFTTKETNKGTGLGLYMSRKIVQEHLRGDIYAGNINDGAKFIIKVETYSE